MRRFGILYFHLFILKIFPITLSKKFVRKYIREKYKFDGLVITDDLVKCFDILDSGLSYERKKMINSLESKRKRKILDFKKKE